MSQYLRDSYRRRRLEEQLMFQRIAAEQQNIQNFLLLQQDEGTSVFIGGNTEGIEPISGTDTFSTIGTYDWVAPYGVTSVEYLVVGGGGGAGNGYDNAGGGGGGAGMVLNGNLSVIPGNTYSITIGAGGSGGIGDQSTTPPGRSNAAGSVGGTSIFSTIIALGGGQGLGSRTGGGAGVAQSTNVSAASGGSGSGGGFGGKGGGGASTNGSNNSGGSGGAGGAGVSYSISGSSVTYGAGGSGGGTVTTNGANGTANRGNGGNGGGGSSGAAGNGGNGGSGIVIIKY